MPLNPVFAGEINILSESIFECVTKNGQLLTILDVITISPKADIQKRYIEQCIYKVNSCVQRSDRIVGPRFCWGGDKNTRGDITVKCGPEKIYLQ